MPEGTGADSGPREALLPGECRGLSCKQDHRGGQCCVRPAQPSSSPFSAALGWGGEGCGGEDLGHRPQGLPQLNCLPSQGWELAPSVGPVGAKFGSAAVWLPGAHLSPICHSQVIRSPGRTPPTTLGITNVVN